MRAIHTPHRVLALLLLGMINCFGLTFGTKAQALDLDLVNTGHLEQSAKLQAPLLQPLSLEDKRAAIHTDFSDDNLAALRSTFLNNKSNGLTRYGVNLVSSPTQNQGSNFVIRAGASKLSAKGRIGVQMIINW